MTDTADHFPVVQAGDDLSDEIVSLVRRWLSESARVKPERSATLLAGVVKDPNGLAFTVGFIDGVIRPEDPVVAARSLARLARNIPRSLPWHLRVGVRLGGVAGRAAPRLVIPLVRHALRLMVRHLIIDATSRSLGRSIAKIQGHRFRLNANLLGEAVLGEKEAARRRHDTRVLLARPDIDYVSIKVSAMVAPHSVWAFDEVVQNVVTSLRPLFECAVAAPNHKFINLDMEEYGDLDLTIAVFTTLLDSPDLLGLQAGIVLQAYLPDALGAMIRLQEWASDRRSRGGAPIKVRLVKGANLPMERVEASLHGWPLATWDSKQDTDANYKRIISYALEPERIRNVRIGVAGHNLFDLAFAWLLAGRRGVRDGIDIEMLLGMASGQADVIRREVGGILLYTPIVPLHEFDAAIAYLVRRLEEGACQENFLSAIFDLDRDEALFEREKQRFISSLNALNAFDDSLPAPRRTQNRLLAPLERETKEFYNAPDTDPSLPANRRWGHEILARAAGSTLGAMTVDHCKVRTASALDRVLGGAVASAPAWGGLTGAERAEVLERVAHLLETRRGDLVEVMISEASKTLDQADPEVSEAIDFARYYAQLARELDLMDGATFVPCQLTVVTPPWNFPVAIAAGSVLGALAAGSAVIIKPAAAAVRCGSVMVETLWEAGVPREVLRLVDLPESDLGARLIADPRVDRVVLTGAYETAELFRSFRPDLPLLAETSGKNAIVVTPSADFDLAVRDVVHSAFSHAGQKCSAASLVILVGSVGTSRRFRDQLVDAVTSLTVGPATTPLTQMGPLIRPAQGKLLDALTTLAPGESWVVQPQRLDDDGRLWSPGVREGVMRGSKIHLTEFFGPVLGIMTAATLEEAIEIQNEVDYGLTAGLHSLDCEEIAAWLEAVEAGNLYVNRGITGAIVRRQPFGGWRKSVVGTGNKAGGPHYLFGLGDWRPSRANAPQSFLSGPVEDLLHVAAEIAIDPAEKASLRRSFLSDAQAWRSLIGTPTDISGLTAERNVLRHLPVPVLVRLERGGTVAELVRVVGAGLLAGSVLTVSTVVPLPPPLVSLLLRSGATVDEQGEQDWLETAPRLREGRVRLIGGFAASLAKVARGRPDLAIYGQPVTESGRLELLPFVREQAISITAHRLGTPNHLTDGLFSTCGDLLHVR